MVLFPESLKWNLSIPQVTTALLGADHTAQLEDSLSIVERPNLAEKVSAPFPAHRDGESPSSRIGGRGADQNLHCDIPGIFDPVRTPGRQINIITCTYLHLFTLSEGHCPLASQDHIGLFGFM